MAANGCQPTNGLDNVARRTHCAFRCVLVRMRIAEVSKDAVAQVLGEIAVVARDRAGAGVLIGTHDVADVFGIGTGGEFGRADEIGEHYCELPALAIG